MKKPAVAAVVAIGKNRELGRKGKLLWRIPDDLARFKRLTLGHPVVMGRKTFESIIAYNGRPLSGRTTIVVTRHPECLTDFASPPDDGLAKSVIAADSLDEAIRRAEEFDGEEIHIGGGAEIYRQALPRIDKLYLTLIEAEAPDADSFFPPYEDRFAKKTFEESREWNGLKYRWVDLER